MEQVFKFRNTYSFHLQMLDICLTELKLYKVQHMVDSILFKGNLE